MKKILLVNLCLLLLCISEVYAQTRTVTGVVTSKDDGLPLPGVTVRASGGSVGTQTNAEGRYTLAVPATTQKLDFVYVGYATLSATIGASNQLNVSLSADNQQLNEVIVTAAGLASSRRAQGVNVTTVKSEQLTAAKATTIAGGLLGKVPGLQINGATGGVNPNFRVVLRGQRSITGNNEALIVLDGVIVPNSVLNNLNPEDVEDVNVLNGASGAALYGSDASNGALVIRTKKGKKGQLEIKAQQTVTVDKVSFYPKLQNKFGSGSDNDLQLYLSYENQQYGPAFDGVVRDLGLPVSPNGPVQQVAYSPSGGKNGFWETGIASQTDLSLSSGDDKGTFFMSGQYLTTSGVVPKDKFNRANIRLGGTRNISKILSSTYSIGYTQNRYDQTSAFSSVYDQVLATPAQAPLTQYKNWQTDPFANPNGYYNAYLQNPYFTVDNNRRKTRNDYLTGAIDLKLAPTKWFDLTYRLGFTTRNNTYKQSTNKFTYSDYTKSLPETASTYKRSDIAGSVTDYSYYTTRITNELLANFRKQVGDFNLNLVVAGFLRQDRDKELQASVSGLLQPGLFNLGNSTAPPTASEANYIARQQAVYGLLTVNYKDYLILNATGRNDWDSRLLPENRSFFYPSVNLSFIPTDAISALKDIKQIDYIKIRGGYSKVGQVNLGTGTGFGSAQLLPTFTQGSGYPFNGQGGLTVGNRLVSSSLKPEFTKGYELGLDAGFFKNRIVANVTYYNNKTSNQTLVAAVSNATGFSQYLLNAGQTSSQGWETSLNVTPVRTKNWTATFGANFTYYNNMVDYLQGGIPSVTLAAYTGGAGSYAIAGQPFPVLQARQYVRDDQGRIIVNPVTGYPSGTNTLAIFGNAAPKQILGLTANLNYKNISLSAVGEYRGGYKVYNSVSTGFDFYGSGINTIAYDRERFVIPNSSYLSNGQYVANTNITVKDGGPAYWTIAGPRTAIDENYITSGAFWKIREITLSYTLPSSLLTKSKFIRAARISAQGRNLWIFLPKTAVYTDPEYSAGNDTGTGNGVGLNSTNTPPPSRYFGATLSLTF